MPSSVFTTVMDGSTAAASLTSAVDIGEKQYNSAYLEIPTMTSNSALNVLAAATLDGTYRQVYHPAINTSTAEANAFQIASSVSGLIPIPNGLQYLKIQATASVSFSASFKIHTSSF